MDPAPINLRLARYLTDSTLGRLAKWMRLAGLDTLMDASTPHPQRLKRISEVDNRWILTRTQKVFQALGRKRCLFIESNAPVDQVRQVMRHFKISRAALQPLSRCLRCNQELIPMEKESLLGRIPEHIWHQHDRFMTCSECQQVYWPGTHTGRVMALIDRWFQ